MPEIHIVTDSCASFVNSAALRQYPVTIVPNTFVINGQKYREGVDASRDELLGLFDQATEPPKLIPPGVDDFLSAYAQASRSAEAILSIHVSRELLPIWERARKAAQQMLGHCALAVIDSRAICAGQGMLVLRAAQTLSETSNFDDLANDIRSAVDRVYAVYYTESLDFLSHNGVFSRSHAILGTMLGIKPFIAIEEGDLVVIEKVRTRGQAVERLVEFAVEFTELEDGVVVHNKAVTTDHTRSIQERLTAEFIDMSFPLTTYSPALATLIGMDATGVVILEKEMEIFLADDIDD